MTSRTLTVAGWLAMASAFLALPMVYLAFTLFSRTDLESAIILTIIEFIGTIFLIGILAYIKQFLNALFKFHDLNRNINLLISMGFIIAILSVTAIYATPLKESIGNITLVILILQGIVQAQFGYKLLKLPNDLSGMLKPFCYLNIATGILMASVLLIPLAIVVSAISDLMIGTIFFQTSKLLKNNEQKTE